MPAVSTKQYGVYTPAGTNTPGTSVTAAPAVPGRSMLFIQNTGGNPGLLHFNEAVQGDSTDIIIPVGGDILFAYSCTAPGEKINMGSALGTVWAVLEQVTTP